MMNKSKTARIYLVSFLFVLPILALSIVVFRNRSQPSPETEIERIFPDMFSRRMTHPSILTGIVLDGQSGLPVVKLPVQVSINGTFHKTIMTDQNGFYYEKISPNDSIQSLGLEFETGVYKGFGQSMSVMHGESQVVFLARNEVSELQTAHFWIDDSEFKRGPSANIKQDALLFLQEKAKENAHVYNLVMGFRDKYHWTNTEVTRFQNGYFDRKRNLIGYVNDLKFYLDGKQATYQEINEAFEYSRVSTLNVDPIFEGTSSMLTHKLASKMSFYTFTTSKEAPAKEFISKDNIVIEEVKSFDLSLLEKDAYMLDGFRQVNGIGSNLRPIKEDIKRIFLFKGNLARYYDRKLEKLWWIETRPIEEVYERPDLAIK